MALRSVYVNVCKMWAKKASTIRHVISLLVLEVVLGIGDGVALTEKVD